MRFPPTPAAGWRGGAEGEGVFPKTPVAWAARVAAPEARGTSAGGRRRAGLGRVRRVPPAAGARKHRAGVPSQGAAVPTGKSLRPRGRCVTGVVLWRVLWRMSMRVRVLCGRRLLCNVPYLSGGRLAVRRGGVPRGVANARAGRRSLPPRGHAAGALRGQVGAEHGHGQGGVPQAALSGIACCQRRHARSPSTGVGERGRSL